MQLGVPNRNEEEGTLKLHTMADVTAAVRLYAHVAHSARCRATAWVVHMLAWSDRVQYGSLYANVEYFAPKQRWYVVVVRGTGSLRLVNPWSQPPTPWCLELGILPVSCALACIAVQNLGRGGSPRVHTPQQPVCVCDDWGLGLHGMAHASCRTEVRHGSGIQ